jgi:DUF1365 family protein
MTASRLYAGKVVHVRHKPVSHRLEYRVFMGLFDLDELPLFKRGWRVFGYNRPGLISFHDSDHGDGTGAPLRPQIERALADAGIAPAGGAIRVLCMPRMLGYVFNPLSVYFCHDRRGNLSAIVHEVNNTFGQRHFYALPVQGGDTPVRQHCRKRFRVSPFLPMELDYRFAILVPEDKVAVRIAVERHGDPVMSAWFAGENAPLNQATLFKLWLRHPAMTHKVIAGIHWEALALWRKLRRVSGRSAPETSRLRLE